MDPATLHAIDQLRAVHALALAVADPTTALALVACLVGASLIAARCLPRVLP